MAFVHQKNRKTPGGFFLYNTINNNQYTLHAAAPAFMTSPLNLRRKNTKCQARPKGAFFHAGLVAPASCQAPRLYNSVCHKLKLGIPASQVPRLASAAIFSLY
jgi:hypothetical protein